MKIQNTDMFCHSEGLKVRPEEDCGITIYDRATGHIHELNSSAAFIFRLVAEGSDVSTIIEIYEAEYDLDTEKSRKDVGSVIRKLLRIHLIQKRENR